MPEYIWWIIAGIGTLVFIYILVALALGGFVWNKLLEAWKDLGDF